MCVPLPSSTATTTTVKGRRADSLPPSARRRKRKASKLCLQMSKFQSTFQRASLAPLSVGDSTACNQNQRRKKAFSSKAPSPSYASAAPDIVPSSARYVFSRREKRLLADHQRLRKDDTPVALALENTEEGKRGRGGLLETGWGWDDGESVGEWTEMRIAVPLISRSPRSDGPL